MMEKHERVVSPGLKPLCGYDWLWQHYHDLDNWKPVIEITRPGAKYTITTQNAKALNEAVKEVTR